MQDKAWRSISIILIAAGALMIAWPVYQYLYSLQRQDTLIEEFEQARTRIAEAAPAEEDYQPSHEPRAQPETIDEGPFVLIIPAIALRVAVVDGIGEDELTQGPGFYPQSGEPGKPGNVAIAGHRNSHGAWFRNLHSLEAEDTIIIQSPRTTYLYSVESVFVVKPDALEVVDPTEEAVLTLTTCHPIGSLRERLIVRAELVEIQDLQLDAQR